ncbi:MAG: flagellar protein export ATPase FliI [bacterium]
MNNFNADKYKSCIRDSDPVRYNGKVRQVIGLVIESHGPAASVGEICLIERKNASPIKAEVVGFRENNVLLMPLGEMHGICPDSNVISSGRPLTVKVGPRLLGRVVDALGVPIDGKGMIEAQTEVAIDNPPPPPMQRRRISEPLSTGIRAIDGLLTCGKGQRIGVFSGSGVGKSTTLGMIARFTSADVNVVALVGERGREVRDFVEKDLGEEGLSRSVVVVGTSDQPALIRMKTAFVATAIAEYFRDQENDVLLMMDSVTRFAMAQREVGLAVGEPPTTRGYTPSVFALLPKLLERSGTSSLGTITGLYTVLVEADDMNEPVADSIRAILDGHIVLSRDLAAQNHYPPIDVLNSISRLMIDVVSNQHRESAGRLRDVLAAYRDSKDLVSIGAYVNGSNPRTDYALQIIDAVDNFLKQGISESSSFQETAQRLISLTSPHEERAVSLKQSQFPMAAPYRDIPEWMASTK